MKTHLIHISKETYKRLKALSKPNEPSEKTITELLDAVTNGTVTPSNTTKPQRTRLPSALLLPLEGYTLPILEALYELGGMGLKEQVLDRIHKKLIENFSIEDLIPQTSNNISRWRNRAQLQRLTMIHEGLLKPDSRFGIWEISSSGMQRLKEQPTEQKTVKTKPTRTRVDISHNIRLDPLEEADGEWYQTIYYNNQAIALLMIHDGKYSFTTGTYPNKKYHGPYRALDSTIRALINLIYYHQIPEETFHK